MTAFDGLLHDAMLTAALLCVPVLALAAAIGAVIAVLQAATQVQEQTLGVLPKIVAVGAAVAVFGNAGLHLCMNLMHDVVHAIPSLVYGL